MLDVILKRFEAPDQTITFPKGRFELVHVGNSEIGRAAYEPGWKWSEHVRPIAGTQLCEVEHLGVVLAGRAVAALNDGRNIELTPGTVFYIPPIPHDSWVVGDERYVSLHLKGAEKYAK